MLYFPFFNHKSSLDIKYASIYNLSGEKKQERAKYHELGRAVTGINV